MIDGLKKRINRLSLESKIRYSYAFVLVPMVILLVVCVLVLYNENRKYDDMIEAAGSASRFSLNFKEDFDYETYLVIVESKPFSESELKDMVRKAEAVLEELGSGKNSKVKSGKSVKNDDRLEDIRKYLRNLEVYIDRIEENLKQGDRYDENIEIWENDVQIVTSLIRETIILFIYDELQEIREMRNEMNLLYTNIIKYLGVAAVCVIGLVIIISYYVSRSITSPIKHLSRVTEKVARGDLTVRSNLEIGAEVGVLSKSFDSMIERINGLLAQVRQEQITLRKTELELLQSQINPHFLYNTLDTIVWLAEAGDQQKVVKMVGSLSDFFRTTLNQGRDIVTIRDELKHIRSYLEIQQVRYQDILEYVIDVPEELYGYMIPKLTLQPLVENALYHGIKNKRGIGKITVTGEMKSGFFMMYVEDNGIGMEQDRFLQVQNRINNKENNDDESFGLNNVNERIRLKFGAEYGLIIESKYGDGTKVGIKLPLELV